MNKIDTSTEDRLALVIENEPFVAMDIEGHLQDQGFKCLIAADAVTAQKLLADNKDAIQLITCDNTLNGSMEGKELYHFIRSQGNITPVLFISGMNQEDGERIGAGDPHFAFSAKPVHGNDIKRAITKLFANPKSAAQTGFARVTVIDREELSSRAPLFAKVGLDLA